MMKRTFDRAALVVLVSSFALVAFAYYQLPPTIPIHFDYLGNPSAYGPKATLWLEPLLALLLYAFLGFISRLPLESMNLPVAVTDANREALQEIVLVFLSFTRLCIVTIFACIALATIASASSGSLSPWFLSSIVLLVVALFAGLIAFVVAARKTAQ
jgi:uncharacterized membrane protein